jgi:hypothetical protein
VYDEGIEHYWKKGGCNDQINQCRERAKKSDPEDAEVNTLCSDSIEYCRVHCTEVLFASDKVGTFPSS